LDDPALEHGNSNVADDGMVFNLFIEGEEVEAETELDPTTPEG
jgi:hypothetical protein